MKDEEEQRKFEDAMWQLYLWRSGVSCGFFFYFFNLLQLSQPENRTMLSESYPHHVAAYDALLKARHDGINEHTFFSQQLGERLNK